LTSSGSLAIFTVNSSLVGSKIVLSMVM